MPLEVGRTVLSAIVEGGTVVANCPLPLFRTVDDEGTANEGLSEGVCDSPAPFSPVPPPELKYFNFNPAR
jgi:hypothetical protein